MTLSIQSNKFPLRYFGEYPGHHLIRFAFCLKCQSYFCFIIYKFSFALHQQSYQIPEELYGKICKP